MYYILVRHYYYNSSLHAPSNGPLHGITENEMSYHPLTFSSVEEAKKYLAKHGITRQISKQMFCADSVYVLSHGEYERPDYWIRKLPNN